MGTTSAPSSKPIPVSAGTLNPVEVNESLQQLKAVAQSSTRHLSPKKFVYFAAFDGTNNDRSKNKDGYYPQAMVLRETNVSQLERQVALSSEKNPNVKSGYYKGVGTGGENGDGLVAEGLDPTPFVRVAAEKAYNDFRVAALDWLRGDKNRSPKDITTATAAFSRGCGSSIVFSQLLNERGLKDDQGNVLIPPWSLSVSAMLLFDPVLTGINGVEHLPPNVAGNVTIIPAKDEFRDFFSVADFSNDPRVKVLPFYGNHGDIGGYYDNGIGALTLAGATKYFSNSGVPISAVPPERAFQPEIPTVIHTEAFNSEGERIWAEHGTRGNRGILPREAPPALLVDGIFLMRNRNGIYQDISGRTATQLFEPRQGNKELERLVEYTKNLENANYKNKPQISESEINQYKYSQNINLSY